MRVFNLTNGVIDYKNHPIPAFGSVEFPELKVVPARDLALQKAGLLAFGNLPKGWVKPEPKPDVASLLVVAISKAVEDLPLLVEVKETLKEKELPKNDFKFKKK